ncbi:COX15/CtaA family protein [uncultured Enterovirga sp.]|uniref:COX15/CtaA family protein n=1 Tax=uncultured Enterovirga sp. TaxID=2026352 RepID=UPI0035CBB4A5
MAVSAATAEPHDVTGDPARVRPRSRLVSVWLWSLVVLVVVMVGIGGATRLTGSGLSITEWKPVTGAVPPLSDGAWTAEFEKYRASSQYRNLNRGMDLPEFKTIYWWEWSHRQLGRLLGLVFAVPLIGFWATGAIRTRLAFALLGIGALGGLQATVGWIMVASGLEPGMIAVAPLKLMLHLVLASAILALLVWVATGPKPPRHPGAAERNPEPMEGPRKESAPRTVQAVGPGFSLREPRNDRVDALRAAGEPRSTHLAAAIFLGLVLLQIALGGLVAGSRAGWTYNTWPLMDGRLVPPVEALTSVTPWFENFVDNPALVQLNHRLTAYLLVAFALWQAWSLRRRLPGSPASHRAAGLAGLTLAQMALGIATLVLVVPLWAGLAHQLLAMALLVAATVHLRRSRTAAA